MVDGKSNDMVITPGIQALVSRSIGYIKAGFPVHFTGPAGVGKTTIAQYLATQLGRPVTTIYGSHNMSNFDLLGGTVGISENITVDNYIHSVYKRERRIEDKQIQGQLVTAVQNGHTLIYDEFTRSHSETNNVLLSVLEEKVLPLYGVKNGVTKLSVHPDFSIILTSNPSEYAGVFESADALIDRLITINLEYLDLETEAEIVTQKTGAQLADSRFIAGFVSRIRASYFYGKSHGPSIRASIKLAKVATVNCIPVDPRNESFQTLCCDILGPPLAQLRERWNPSKIRDLIVSELTTR